MAVALAQAELILGVLFFGKSSVNRSNGRFHALPHSRNSAGVSFNPTVQVVEVPGAMDGSHGHNTRHKSTVYSVSLKGLVFNTLVIQRCGGN